MGQKRAARRGNCRRARETRSDRDARAKDGEQTPVYAMSFELYENGVSRALVLDYNDFVISGAMGKFDVKDSTPCK